MGESADPAGAGRDARRVLVVEDDAVFRRVLADVLLDEGYEVRVAEHGAAGLAMLDSWLPDVILLDLTLPVMDGRGFCEAQRALRSPASDVPVLLMTGHDSEHLASEVGAAGIIRKPFGLDEISVRLAEMLDGPAPGRPRPQVS